MTEETINHNLLATFTGVYDGEQLADSELRFRALADNVAQLVWMAEPGGKIFWFNQRWYDFTGVPIHRMTGNDSAGIIHPDHRERVVAKYYKQTQQGKEWDDTFQMRGQNGEYRWFLSRAAPVRDAAGRILLWCGTNTDVTDHRLAEERLAAAFKRESLINKIGEAIRSTRNPEDIQSTAVNELGQALGVERAYFTITNNRRGSSWIGRDYRKPDLPSIAGEYNHAQYKVDPSGYHPDGRTLVVTDVDTWDWPEPFANILRSLRIRAAIKVPMYAEGRMVARLVVAMANAPREWTADEVALVEAVAVQTRAAVDAAFTQEKEHHIAEQLQNALRPALPETVPGLTIGAFTRPALEEAAIGGDFFDVFSLSDSLHALIIGDVSGKGLAAAQQLALVRNCLRTTLYLFHSPVEAAARLNEILVTHNLLSGFVTLFIAIFDSETGKITYANCGHEPGLVRRNASSSIELLESSGFPLGVEGRAAFEEGVLQISSGDQLMLYTDGFTELGKSSGKILGTEGIAQLLSALPAGAAVDEAAEQLVKQAEAAAGVGFHDDVAVLMIRCD